MITSIAIPHELTLLVVDPYKSSGVYCCALLQAAGHRTIRVAKEQDALARVEEVDGVISEVLGFPPQFAARLREVAQNPHLAVIALTAYTLVEEYNRILRAGFTACIKKPLRATAFASDVIELVVPTLGYSRAHAEKTA